ncbi:MAG: hypothetical protein AAF628_20845 [Planctomycetota bacterium]
MPPPAESAPSAALTAWRDPLRQCLTGTKLVLVGGPVVGLVGLARQVRALGAARPFLLGCGVGTGVLPRDDEAEWHALDIQGADDTAVIRRYEQLLQAPPPDAVAALDRYDSDHRARALGLILLGRVTDVAGRPRLGVRPQAWLDLEDKVVIDAFFDRAGIARAPSAIVPADPDAAAAAAHSLDEGAGVVCAADASQGVHGGGCGLRWVAGDGEVRDVAARMAATAQRLRIMPFLRGTPCSVHGLVAGDGTAVFRPVELLTLRGIGARSLHYAGCATLWDPPATAREDMRTAARRVAVALHRDVGYRGSFTLDGVLTDAGFRPTELNPRIGAGLMTLEAACGPDLPLGLISVFAVDGAPLHGSAAALEAEVLGRTDRCRVAAARTLVATRHAATTHHELQRDAHGHLALARPGATSGGRLTLGPSARGGFVAFAANPAHLPPGPRFAPLAAEAFAFADRVLGAGVGPVQAI